MRVSRRQAVAAIAVTSMAPSRVSAVAPAATAESNRRTARRYVQDVLVSGQIGVMDEIVAPDIMIGSPGGAAGIVNVKATVAASILALNAGFPGFQIDIDGVVADANAVAHRLTLRGIHRGEFAGIAATNRSVSTVMVAFYEFTDGMIDGLWSMVNSDDLLLQLMP